MKATHEFLNASLQIALPMDGLATLVDFLNVVDVSTEFEVSDNGANSFATRISTEDEALPGRFADDILQLAEACSAELTRLQATLAAGNSLDSGGVAATPPTGHTSKRDSLVSDVYRSMQTVMEGRDRAHANAVASRLLQEQEVEALKGKVDLLEHNIQALRLRQTDGEGSVPSGQLPPTAPVSKVAHNMDEEIMQLCQQLSGEIAARAEAGLEVVRVRELREIESANEQKSRRSLEQELEELREELALRNESTARAEKEALEWKKAFDELTLLKEKASK